ncbi:hypothetical protein MPL3356_40249 [Mesorhizobium plurifarium]|uniref:Uncharacterized protein n=1 Tax=Mesorhizobium plurifarium TaxID=69974 RepID=A0A090E167_MESPL|nr:hypothetical protein MPL3356_40249 [Mesorhizobium plurifarium]
MTVSGPEFASGDRVRLLRLSDEFLSDLSAEDIAVLKALIGREWIVDEWHEGLGQVEISNCPSRTSKTATIHSVWVPPEWVERVE